MTYDWAGGGYYLNTDKQFENLTETYRLPLTDGSIKEFERKSEIDEAKSRRDTYWTSFKALYSNKNMTIRNMVSVDFDRTPKKYESGTVTYSPDDYPNGSFQSNNKNRINTFAYNGYCYFTLPHNNTLTFNPQYAYSHTNQWTSYIEQGFNDILNGAKDDSHQLTGDLAFVHSFGKKGKLQARIIGELLHNKTAYSGTSTLSDEGRLYRIGPGVNYSISLDKFYGAALVGFYWDNSIHGTVHDHSISPFGNISLQYAFSQKNSVSANFNYSQWLPSSNFRSASVIKSNPLMYYTGNPNLVPFNSYQSSLQYTYIPNNKYNLSAFGHIWFVGNRYVYDYEGYEDYLLRTIKQPLGKYTQWMYGIQGSTRQFDSKLQVSGSVFLRQARNGAPYNWNKSHIDWSLRAYYYLNNIYFGASYGSPAGSSDGAMVGIWIYDRSRYDFQVGWSNKNWNLRFYAKNFFRYNTYGITGIMDSKYYGFIRNTYTASATGFFQISATYTFSYGKKVKEANEAYQAQGAASGILK